MAFNSAIEWTDATWNPWTGCHKVSAGCKNCYMFRDKARYGQDPNVVVRSADKTFYAPLKWAEPKKIFTCSWSDFFIEESDPWRDEAFAIMALTPRHTYQVLTKRPDRMREWFHYRGTWPILTILESLPAELVQKILISAGGPESLHGIQWPLPNVWLGVSAEDRDTYITRVPYLAMTPGKTKFLSFEPLLGDIGDLMLDGVFEGSYQWAIAGGESGPNARPTHPDWIRSIRDQSTAAGVAFHFKQWGEWMPGCQGTITKPGASRQTIDGHTFFEQGKKKAGRLLDDREWNEIPETVTSRS